MATDYVFCPSLQYFLAQPCVGVKEKDALVAQVSSIHSQDKIEPSYLKLFALKLLDVFTLNGVKKKTVNC